MKNIRTLRFFLWVLVAISAFATVTFLLYDSASNLTQDQSALNQISDIGGPFTLIDGNGQQFTEQNIIGKPTVIFFGFTHCPDVCPTTLAETQFWINQLGKDADKLNFLFVTVDPERDTPEVLRDYISSFDERIIPLTGSKQQVNEMIKSYRVYAQKVELDDGDYTMDHTASVYLMNSQYQFDSTISYGENSAIAIEKLEKLIQEGIKLL